MGICYSSCSGVLSSHHANPAAIRTVAAVTVPPADAQFAHAAFGGMGSVCGFAETVLCAGRMTVVIILYITDAGK